MTPRVLLVTDSMGSDYGATGFARVAYETWDASVNWLVYAGLPIAQVAEDLAERVTERYDVAVVQLGVPDVHPRFPLPVMRALRRLGLRFVRENFFFTPPRFGLLWLVKSPLLLLRLVSTRLHRACYTSTDDLVEIHGQIVAELSEKASRVLTLPVFEVSPIYGRDHTTRARAANERLAAAYGEDFVRCPALEPSVYGRFRNHDYFHFRDPYHRLLAAELEPIVLGAVSPTSVRG